MAIEDYLPMVKILHLGDYINIGLFRHTAESLDQKGYIKNIKIIDIRSYNTRLAHNLIDDSKDKKQKLINILKEEENLIQILDKILNIFISNLKIQKLIRCFLSL